MSVAHGPTLHASDVAVLCSGGLDSIVLAADLATSAIVQPLYVRSGLWWEVGEQAAVDAVLAHVPQRAQLRSLVALDVPMTDLYAPTHWALTGQAPAYDTPDEDVYLVGRNVTLITKAAVYCAMQGITRLCLAPLAGNPFPDATPEFFETMSEALTLGLRTAVRIDAPYRTWSKADVIRRGDALGVPLTRTMSCMQPVDSRHCGACSKCRERHEAFLEALGTDPTEYVTPRAGARRQ